MHPSELYGGKAAAKTKDKDKKKKSGLSTIGTIATAVGPGLLKLVKSIGSHFLDERAKTKETGTEIMKAHQARLEAARTKKEEAAEKAALMAAASLAGPSIIQSRQVATDFADALAKRYPVAFTAFPTYYQKVVDQVLAALLNPADPTDALYAQKVMGSIEYEAAITSQRLDPTRAAQSLAPTAATSSHKPPKATAPGQSGSGRRSAGLLQPSSGARRRGGGGLLSPMR